MMLESVIVTVLALAMCAAAISLWLDARERRINRQLAIALPTSHPANLPSIRRLETGSQAQFLNRLSNYNPDIPYVLHPAYVLLAGAFEQQRSFMRTASWDIPWSTCPSSPQSRPLL